MMNASTGPPPEVFSVLSYLHIQSFIGSGNSILPEPDPTRISARTDANFFRYESDWIDYFGLSLTISGQIRIDPILQNKFLFIFKIKKKNYNNKLYI